MKNWKAYNEIARQKIQPTKLRSKTHKASTKENKITMKSENCEASSNDKRIKSFTSSNFRSATAWPTKERKLLFHYVST